MKTEYDQPCPECGTWMADDDGHADAYCAVKDVNVADEIWARFTSN